ncbi:MAG: hypothetical protein NW205_06065 [Hyphomicrobiaceae bacterium]|nr:hypothetical protein [Hyphomicrobiaceae bacterium]
MNATSRDELRQAQALRQVQDEKMEQVRELLIGDLMRQNELRLAAMEARLRQLEVELGGRIEALRMRLDAVAGEVSASQRGALDDLARGIDDLGARVRQLARR